MTKSQVPYFTNSAIHLAHISALELWRGYSYTTGNELSDVLVSKSANSKINTLTSVLYSDEYILERLSSQLYSIVNPKIIKNNIAINDSFLESFRKITGIKLSDLNSAKPIYKDCINYLEKQVAIDYRNYKKSNSFEDKSKESINCIKNLSSALTANLSNKNNLKHITFATRLLFFVMPDCLIFNYSPEIARKLKLKGDGGKDISEYQEILWTGLNNNWETLSKFEMPVPKNMNYEAYKIIKNSGWWQRRILDLALKLHFTDSKKFKLSDNVKSQLFTKSFLIT